MHKYDRTFITAKSDIHITRIHAKVKMVCCTQMEASIFQCPTLTLTLFQLRVMFSTNSAVVCLKTLQMQTYPRNLLITMKQIQQAFQMFSEESCNSIQPNNAQKLISRTTRRSL